MLLQKIGILLVVLSLSCKEKKGISNNQSFRANKSLEKDLNKIIVNLDTVFLGNWEKMYVLGAYGVEFKSV